MSFFKVKNCKFKNQPKRESELGFNTFSVNLKMVWIPFILLVSYNEDMNQYARKIKERTFKEKKTRGNFYGYENID
jgi:hypothetical protein